VRCKRGEAEIIVRFAPRFDYGEPMIRLQPRWNGVLATDAQDDVLTLAGPRDIWWRFDGGVAVAAIKLREGEQAWFVARYDDDGFGRSTTISRRRNSRRPPRSGTRGLHGFNTRGRTARWSSVRRWRSN